MGKWFAPVLTIGIFACLVLLMHKPADAYLQVCDKSSQGAYVAFAVEHDYEMWDETETHGWYHVKPGECATLWNGDLQYTEKDEDSRSYYLYADGESSGKWSGGGGPFCSNSRYKFDLTDEYEACKDDSDSNFTKRGFRKLDIGTYTNYIYSLYD